jgi:lysozyme
MKTSQDGVAFIAAQEGVVTRAYRDPAGVWTIGVGHTAAAGPPVPKKGLTISRQAALGLLAADLPGYEAAVASALGAGEGSATRQSAFDGAVSFHYNTGAIGQASWVAKFRDRQFAEAETALKAWNKAGGRVMNGLVRRRAAEADLIFRDHYPDAVAADAAFPMDQEEIASCQTALIALGHAGVLANGALDAATEAAILAFQKANDLVPDGIAGPATRAMLARRLAEARAKKVAGAAAGGGAAGGAAIKLPGAAAGGSGLDALLWTIGGALALALLTLAAFLLWRNRGAIRLWFTLTTKRLT